MKVVHLFDLYLPATMNWVSELLRASPEVEQCVAAPWILDNEYHYPEFRFYTQPIQKALGWMPSDEWRAAWFSTNLIRVEKHWPFYRNWLFKQLKSNPPDVLHAHFAPVGCHYLDMAKRLGIPLVTSFYGYDYARLPFEKPVYRKRYDQLFQQAAAITTTGVLSRAILENQGCPPAKISAIPVSILPNAFPYRERYKTYKSLHLVQIATITGKKGHLDTLAAVKIALERCPNLHLSIAGERQDKKLFQEIQRFVEVNHLAQNVTLLDFIPHADLPRFLAQFDVFIHPSRTTTNRDCEGAPMAILEAMAVGLPVISTVHSDIPMQVLHGQTGLLAPERDPPTLAKHIERFYNMGNDEYQVLSRAGSAHVKEHFDVEYTAVRLRTLYESIIHP